VFELVHHGDRDLLADVRPGFENLIIPLAVGDDALLEQPLLLQDRLLGGADHLLFVGRRLQIAGPERKAAAGRELKADFLKPVEQGDRLAAAHFEIAVGNDVARSLFRIVRL